MQSDLRDHPVRGVRELDQNQRGEHSRLQRRGLRRILWRLWRGRLRDEVGPELHGLQGRPVLVRPHPRAITELSSWPCYGMQPSGLGPRACAPIAAAAAGVP